MGVERHIGYYKGTKRSSWVARMRLGAAYIKEKLGYVDDVHDADGISTLSWDQAVAKATTWFASQSLGEAVPDIVPETLAADLAIPTVREALESYVGMRDARETARVGRAVKSDAHRLYRNVLNDRRLADTALDALAEKQLRNWRGALTLKASGCQRLVNDFKAALNDAFLHNRQILPAEFLNIVKFGLRVPPSEVDEADSAARENQILGDVQVRQIVDAAFEVDESGDLGRLVILLAATGARFSQIRRMCVRDVQAAHNRVLIPSSRKGRRKVASLARVQVGQDVLDALEPIVTGRPPDAPLLEHWRHIQTAPAVWKRSCRAPWASAAELTRPWQRVLTKAGLSGVIPYALRHSSVVRGIRVGLPIRLVAALHDTSVAMIERHYARWITEGLDDLAAKAVVPLRMAAGS